VVLDLNANAIAGPDVPLRSPAVYEYTVTNGGTLPLANVTLSDDVCASPTFVSGDSDADTRLDVDEAWVYECVQTDRLTKADGVPANNATQPSVVTNTGTVTGTPVLANVLRTDANVTDTDTATTTVIAPDVSITKTPSETLVRVGDDVTYTYRVRASGDTPVVAIGVVDDLCSPVAFASGDTNNDGVVDLNEVWTYTCTMQLFGPSPVINTAAVLAAGGLGNLYYAETTATVEVFGTDIALDKSVSDELVLRGSTVTYTFEVSNAGTDPVNDVLDQIVLADVSTPANAACNTPTYISGDLDNNDTLAVDEVWTYRCTGVINDLTIDIAGVQGTDVLGGLVTDFDGAVVAPFDTGISVVKTASVTEVPQGGGPVTYTYEVRNTGNVPLRDVMSRVTDDKCADVQYISGDDGNALLTGENDLFETGGAEVWIFECTTTITVATVNTVTAVGTPLDPIANAVLAPDVSATDQASVTVTIGGSRPPTTLPDTGFDTTRIMWIILAILGLGAAMTRMAARSFGSAARRHCHAATSAPKVSRKHPSRAFSSARARSGRTGPRLGRHRGTVAPARRARRVITRACIRSSFAARFESRTRASGAPWVASSAARRSNAGTDSRSSSARCASTSASPQARTAGCIDPSCRRPQVTQGPGRSGQSLRSSTQTSVRAGALPSNAHEATDGPPGQVGPPRQSASHRCSPQGAAGSSVRRLSVCSTEQHAVGLPASATARIALILAEKEKRSIDG
jgi:uncharacterized repeat protein (TIGR01451 family)